MKKYIALYILLVLISYPIGSQAGDLYRINLSSAHDAVFINSLEIEVVTIIENGYLVLLDTDQASLIENTNIGMELIYPDISFDELLIVDERDLLLSDRYPQIFQGSGIRLLYSQSGSYDPSLTNATPLASIGTVKKVIYAEQSESPLEGTYLLPEGIDTIMAKISSDSLVSYMTHLQSYGCRLTGTAENYAARNWIHSQFFTFGYDSVVIDPFDGRQKPTSAIVASYNIYAVKPGSVSPETQIIIGAHLDAVPDSPGADDNGTGITAMLELARIFKNIDNKKTLVFIAFDSEESWMWGSRHYVDEALARGDNIELMVNLDMLGHKSNTDLAKIMHGANTNYAGIWDQIANEYQRIDGELNFSVTSDHLPFIEAGINVCYLEERIPSTVYHSYRDSIVYLNFDYMTRMTAATLGMIYTVDNSVVKAPGIAFTFSSAPVTLIDPVIPTNFRVEITGTDNGAVLPNSCLLNYSMDGVLYNSIPMNETSPDIYEADLLADIGCMETLLYYITAEEATQGVISSDTLMAKVADSAKYLFYDHFETDLGWEPFVFVPTYRPWDRVIPNAQSYYGPDFDADGDGYCYVTDDGTDYFYSAVYRMDSPSFTLEENSFITYYYYLNLFWERRDDYLSVQINNAGGEGDWRELRHYLYSTVNEYDNFPWTADTITYEELVDLGVTITDNMVMRFYAENPTLGTNFIEAGLDCFEIKKFYCNDDEIKLAEMTQTGEKPFAVNVTSLTRHEVNSYSWDFGDGYISNDADPSHIYETNGIFDLTVEMTTPYGVFSQNFPHYFGVHSDSITATGGGGASGSIVSTFVELHNYLPLEKIIIPVQWSGTLALSCVAYSVEDLRSEQMSLSLINFDNFNKRAIFKLSGAELPPGEGAILKIDFQINGTDKSDTTYLRFEAYNNTPLELTTYSGSYQPTMTNGKVFIGGCCVGLRGNIDNDSEDVIDVADLVYMVDYQFRNGDAPACLDEAELVVDGVIDVADLVFMVDYQFRNGDAPPDCPY